jgi:hypothetical protein
MSAPAARRPASFDLLWDLLTMADAPLNEPAAASSSALSPLRMLLLAVLALGAAALLFDLRSRRAAQAAYDKVPQNVSEGPAKVAELIGRPADEEIIKGTRKIYLWRWPGVANAYTVRAYFGDEDPQHMLQRTLNEPDAPPAPVAAKSP